MRALSLSYVLLVVACGVPEAVTPPAVIESYALPAPRGVEQVTIPTLSSPGWHLNAEPALEELDRLGVSSANGSVWLSSWSRTPHAGTFVVAVKWGAEPPVEFARLRGGSGEGELPLPPPGARVNGTCETATARLLVYEAVEGQPFVPRAESLVGISSKGDEPWQFPAVQRADNFVISWSSCTGFETVRAAIRLQRDPHLANAICEGRCCETPFPRTLITAAHLEVLPTGGTRFIPTIDQSMELPPTIEVNGVSVPLVDGKLVTTTLRPWRAGENRVSIRSGALEPWSATVVLPAAPLTVQVRSSLEPGTPVSVGWEGGAWALAFLVSIHPDESVRAYVPEYVWFQSDAPNGAMVPWAGFRWNNELVTSPTATVRVTARHFTSHATSQSGALGGMFDLSVHAERTLQP
ncbi:MAG: hypothetical protein ABTQ32_07630 [Myxococcaceae bacterium]